MMDEKQKTQPTQILKQSRHDAPPGYDDVTKIHSNRYPVDVVPVVDEVLLDRQLDKFANCA